MIEVYETQRLLVIVVDTEQSVSRIKEVFQRATMLWPEAHAEIKEAADILHSGQILQDYRSQK